MKKNKMVIGVLAVTIIIILAVVALYFISDKNNSDNIEENKGTIVEDSESEREYIEGLNLIADANYEEGISVLESCPIGYKERDTILSNMGVIRKIIDYDWYARLDIWDYKAFFSLSVGNGELRLQIEEIEYKTDSDSESYVDSIDIYQLLNDGKSDIHCEERDDFTLDVSSIISDNEIIQSGAFGSVSFYPSDLNTDYGFLMNFNQALEQRWHRAKPGSVDFKSEKGIKHTKFLITNELEKISRYANEDFDDKALGEYAKKYISALKKSKEALDYYGFDEDKTDEVFSDAYTSRTEAVMGICRLYSLNLCDECETELQEWKDYSYALEHHTIEVSSTDELLPYEGSMACFACGENNAEIIMVNSQKEKCYLCEDCIYKAFGQEQKNEDER